MPSLRDTIPVYFLKRFQRIRKLATNIHHVSRHCLKGFQGQMSKVKVICVQMHEYYIGRGIHLNSMASRLTCYNHVLQIQYICIGSVVFYIR